MLVQGEVKCLHCGFIGGQWVGVKGSPVTEAGYRPVVAGEGKREPDAQVRCARCGGPVFLEGMEPVVSSARLRRIRRLREQIARLDAA
jgi:DNA-directed RNA polymerase subunit RPC12/RpoP